MNTTITDIEEMYMGVVPGRVLQVICVLFLFFVAGISFTPVAAEPSTPDPSVNKEEKEEEETYFEFLKRKARTGTIADRALAMQKLGRIGFPASLSVLEKGIRADDKRVRLSALEAIGRIEHPSANQHLEDALFSARPLLSVRAAEWVKERAPSFGIPLLLKGLEHQSEVVRSGSFTALEQWTGYRFGYNPSMGSDDRTEALKRWRSWWQENRERTEEEWWRNRIRNPGTDARSVSPIVSATKKLTERTCWSCLGAFIELLDHPRGPVRIQALHGLRQLSLHRFDGSSDALHEVANRVQPRWKQWWATERTTTRGEWLMEQFQVYAIMEDVPGVLVLPDRIERIVQDLTNPGLEIPTDLLLDMLRGTRGERASAVRVLRGRTGFTFGTVESGELGKREGVVRKWRKWVQRWGDQSREQWMKHMIEHGRRVQNRTVAAEYLGTKRSESSVQALINYGLRDNDQSVRETAIESLTYVTGRRFDYRADASVEERTNSVQRWEKWWTDQDQFFERHMNQKQVR